MLSMSLVFQSSVVHKHFLSSKSQKDQDSSSSSSSFVLIVSFILPHPLTGMRMTTNHPFFLYFIPFPFSILVPLYKVFKYDHVVQSERQSNWIQLRGKTINTLHLLVQSVTHKTIIINQELANLNQKLQFLLRDHSIF